MFNWITGLVELTGYLGIALLMLTENVFPPIPSELIMPLAGFTAARGELSFVGIVLAGTTGSIVGALFWYGIGRWLGTERLRRWAGRHGRWLTLAPEEVDQATDWFRRYCGLAVLIGRLVPAVRTLISVPAGIAGMPLARFLAYSALGTAAWTALLAGAGYLLEDQYRQVQGWLNPVSNVIFAGIAAWYVYRVVTFRPRPAH
jgi:membrane protein DedA with SNARE-associated domain